MVVHSDSNLGAAAAFVMILGAVIMFLVAAASLASGRFRRAWKTLLAIAGLVGTYALAVIAVSVLTPQRFVNAGDSYCVDVWCIAVEGVTSTPAGQQIIHNVQMRIFSDANHAKTSAGGAVPYLVDERGRRFPLRESSVAIALNMTLDPGQSARTSLTFIAAADSQQLFLTGDAGREPSFWIKLYLGSDDSLLHKRTLLRLL